MTAWCDNTGENLLVELRAGSAGSNTVADHLEVLTAAIAQIPASYRRDLLITCDGAGATKELLAHITTLNAASGRRVHYSVEFDLDECARTAISVVPHSLWQNVIDATLAASPNWGCGRPATRAHARVEDNIRNTKSTGLEHLPTHCALNQAWCNRPPPSRPTCSPGCVCCAARPVEPATTRHDGPRTYNTARTEANDHHDGPECSPTPERE